MRHFLLATLVGIGLAAGLQSAAGQQSRNLSALVTVRGQPVGGNSNEAPRLYCNHVHQTSFNDSGGPLIGTVVSPTIISMPQYICPVAGTSVGMPYSYGNADPTIANEHPHLVSVNVAFRKSKDAASMEIGRTVRLYGDVIDLVRGHQSDRPRDRDILIITDARFAD